MSVCFLQFLKILGMSVGAALPVAAPRPSCVCVNRPVYTRTYVQVFTLQ